MVVMKDIFEVMGVEVCDFKSGKFLLIFVFIPLDLHLFLIIEQSFTGTGDFR